MSAANSYTIELLEEVAEFLEPFMDVVDGSYGEPHPNIAMQLHSALSKRLKRSSVRHRLPHRGAKHD